MEKTRSKEQYAQEFFKENPKVETLWANPEGEFFTDINYANNSLKKNKKGELEGKLEVFVSGEVAKVAKEIIEVPKNPIVPEVVNTLKVSETEGIENKNSSEIVIDKIPNDKKTTVAKTGKKTAVKKVAKDISPEDVKTVNNPS